MAVPRKRMSKARTGKRRTHGAGKMTKVESSTCKTSLRPTPSHRMRIDTGYYKGKKIAPKLM